MKEISKIFKWLKNLLWQNFFICSLLIFSFLWIGFISAHEIIQSEPKKSPNRPPSLEEQKREANSLLTQINAEINRGNHLISQLKTSHMPSKENKKMQEDLKSVAQKLKLAARDREIDSKEPKMAPDSVDGKQTKGTLMREIGDLKNILDSAREINGWLKKQNGSYKQTTKNDVKKLYLSLKKAAEETNKKAQKKKT